MQVRARVRVRVGAYCACMPCSAEASSDCGLSWLWLPPRPASSAATHARASASPAPFAASPILARVGVRGALAKLAMGDIIGDRACWPTDRVGLEAGDEAVGQRCSICNSTRLIASSSSFSADMDVRSVCRSRCSSRSLGFSRTSRRIRARVRGRSVKRLGCVIGSTADLIAQNRSRRCSARWFQPSYSVFPVRGAAPSGRFRRFKRCTDDVRRLPCS